MWVLGIIVFMALVETLLLLDAMKNMNTEDSHNGKNGTCADNCNSTFPCECTCGDGAKPV